MAKTQLNISSLSVGYLGTSITSGILGGLGVPWQVPYAFLADLAGALRLVGSLGVLVLKFWNEL